MNRLRALIALLLDAWPTWLAIGGIAVALIFAGVLFRIVLTGADEQQFQVVAEVLEVMTAG